MIKTNSTFFGQYTHFYQKKEKSFTNENQPQSDNGKETEKPYDSTSWTWLLDHCLSFLRPNEALKERCKDSYDSELEAFKKDFEVEVDFESSEEETCMKNAGHVGFIPVTELHTSHFPYEYQDEDLVETVKILGKLTVKVRVKHIDKVKLGTGKILDITKNTENGICSCSKCRKSSKPSKTWWEIVVLTSKHIIKDNEDARNSTCRLFYDREDSSLVNVDGLKVVKSLQNSYICRLICITCDEDLANQLNTLLDNFTELYEKTFDKFWDVKNPEKLVVIVSHPHGTSQKVTIGKSDEKKQVTDVHSVLTYSTKTCSGSAGAFLYIL